MKTRISLASGINALVATLLVTTQAHAQAIPDRQLSSPWFTDAQRLETQRLERQSFQSAKNVILFIGDGMGISTLTAARILAGRRDGLPARITQDWAQATDRSRHLHMTGRWRPPC